jgi:hypothetical protein
MLPVALHVPVLGSYSSADASAFHDASSFESIPPATRTFPSGSSVAVWSLRATAMLPVERHVPTAGSADAVGATVTIGDRVGAIGGVGVGGTLDEVAEQADRDIASTSAKVKPR